MLGATILSEADGFPWQDGRLAPAAGVRRIALGGRTALFSERAQQLFELNATADAIWQALAAAETPRAAAAALGAAKADDYVAASVEAWIAGGLIAPVGALARLAVAPAFELPFRIAELSGTIALHLEAGDPLAGQVAAAFGQFRAEASGGLELAVVAEAGGYLIFEDRAPLGWTTAERVVPALKARLTEALSQAVGGGAFLLHAALLAKCGRGLLITGQPGAGKTTLTLALAARGMGYGSDDIVRLGADGGLAGVAFAPAAKSGAWDLLRPYLPGLADLPIHLRRDGQQARYAPVSGFRQARVDRLGWAITLARRPGARAALEPVEPLEMLSELIGSAFAADHRLRAEALEALAGEVAQADCRRLVYADLGEAAAAVEAWTDA